MVHLSGTVLDSNPSNCSVYFSGIINGKASVNSDGSFAADLKATGQGQVTAIAQENDTLLTSVPMSAQVTVDRPDIKNFTAVHDADNTWTIQGDVDDLAPGNLPVAFGGPGNLQGMTITTDANGHFTMTVTVTTTAPSFTITATVTDSWCLVSDQASQTCSNG
jgi:hypothetical protein